jgi:hypothetical protein
VRLTPLLLPPLLLLDAFARPATAAPPHQPAVRTQHPPRLDGLLDDPAWALAPPSTGFTQHWPVEGGAPSEATTVRVLYDDDAIYVGVDCQQVRSPLVQRLTRRDRDVEADQVRVVVSSRRDGRTAFEFGVTASGVLTDGLLFDDDEYSRTWDENWEAEVAATATGWSVELRLPLRILRFDPLPVQRWGFQVWRFISARQETLQWTSIPRTASGQVSRFGTVGDFVGLTGRHRFELRPFVVGDVTDLQPGYGPQVGTHRRLSAGADLKLHPTQAMTLDLAVNPDFGQVEADEVILNLGTLETQHEEKRPFFQEGTDIFSDRMLYTRRIGHLAGAPATRPGEVVVERSTPIPIYGAAKLVGRPAPWLALGALSAVTGPKSMRVRLPDGTDQDRLSAPLTLYNALRLRGDLPQGSHLGLVATAVNRAESPGGYPTLADGQGLCPGGARVSAGARCFRDAFVAGLDGRWRSPTRTYAVTGNLAASLLRHGPPRPQRDGSVLRSGHAGPIASLIAAKEGGHWLWDTGVQLTGRHADTNDLGFQGRQNEVRSFLNGSYRTTLPRGPTLETRHGFEAFQQTNLDGLVLQRLFQLYGEWTFRNFWWGEAKFLYSPAAFDDREVGDGTAIQRPRLLGGELEFGTDPRRALVGMAEVRAEWLPGGARYAAEATLTVRLFPQLDLELSPEATYRSGEPRFLERETAGAETRLLFGELEAASLGAIARLTWTFTPRLTLQTYGQVFLLSRRFSSFTQAFAPPRAQIRLGDLVPTLPPAETHDERDGVINANVVLRWEYRLGSILYLVYTRSQHPLDETIRPGTRGLDVPGLARGPAANSFLLKLSYWWG